MEELVFAVPAAELWNLIPYTAKGFINGNSEVLKIIVRKGVFRQRQELEEDQSFKQLISYAVISSGDSFLLFQRKSGQREKRLLNLHTLGAGGHMNPGSSMVSEEEYLIAELKRELLEELTFSDDCFFEDIRFIGFINDDTIPVGRFHIGILYIITVSNRDIYVAEKDKLSASWIAKSDLPQYYEAMETWSRIVVDHFMV